MAEIVPLTLFPRLLFGEIISAVAASLGLLVRAFLVRIGHCVCLLLEVASAKITTAPPHKYFPAVLPGYGELTKWAGFELGGMRGGHQS
jgi:hypothetical protein